MAGAHENPETAPADGSDEPVYEPLFVIKGRRGDQGPFLQRELSILVQEGMLPPMAKVQDVYGGKLMSAQQAIEAIVLPPLPSGSELDAPDDMPTPRAALSPLPDNRPTPAMPTPPVGVFDAPTRTMARPEDLPTANYVPPATGKMSDAGYQPVGDRHSDTTRGVSHIHPGLAARMPHDLPTAAYVPPQTGKLSESGYAPVRLPTGLHDDFEILDAEDPITQRAEPQILAAPPRPARNRPPALPKGRALRGAGSSQIAPAVDDEPTGEDEALFDPADVGGGWRAPGAPAPRRAKGARHARERERKVVARHDRHERPHHRRRVETAADKKDATPWGLIIGAGLVLVVAGALMINWSGGKRGHPPETLLHAALERHAGESEDTAYLRWLVENLHKDCLESLSKKGAVEGGLYDALAYQREMDRRLAREQNAPDPARLDAYARALLNRGQFETAKAWAEQAVARSESRNPDCLDTLALICFNLGDGARATQLETQAIDLLDDGVPSRISRTDMEKSLRRYMAAP